MAVRARGQKVRDDTGQVAFEKEQQCSHSSEIYIVRRVSVTEWINADRVPKVKDRGNLGTHISDSFLPLLPPTHQHYDLQWNTSGQNNPKRQFWATVSTSAVFQVWSVKTMTFPHNHKITQQQSALVFSWVDGWQDKPVFALSIIPEQRGREL